MRRFAVAVLVAAGLVAVAVPAVARATRGGGDSRGVVATSDPVPAQYIVTLRTLPAASSAAATSLTARHGGHVLRTYSKALAGYTAQMTAAQAAELSQDPTVASVEQDGYVSVGGDADAGAVVGLDRIDQRDLPLDNAYSSSNEGAGVTAYIIDTGIRPTVTDFGGRAAIGTDTVGDGQNGVDCNGHGTHVAGTVGGTKYGVAKSVSLVAVRVLDCSGSGTWSGVIAGIDWVTAHHTADAVANMSLGGGAVHRGRHRGRQLGGRRASRTRWRRATATPTRAPSSPARAPTAITVGATTSTDARALVLELRHLRRPVRAGFGHHLRLEHERHRDQHDQRHVDGHAARGRERGPVPRRARRRIAGDRHRRVAERSHAEPGHRGGRGIAQPPRFRGCVGAPGHAPPAPRRPRRPTTTTTTTVAKQVPAAPVLKRRAGQEGGEAHVDRAGERRQRDHRVPRCTGRRLRPAGPHVARATTSDVDVGTSTTTACRSGHSVLLPGSYRGECRGRQVLGVEHGGRHRG